MVQLGSAIPEHANYLSLVALRAGDLDLARTIIADWERQAPKDIMALKQHAHLEFACGAFGKVLDLTAKIHAMDPKNRWANEYRDAALNGIRALSQRLPEKKEPPPKPK